MKRILMLVILSYLFCVAFCTYEHNKEAGISGWNPCASCWALRKE